MAKVKELFDAYRDVDDEKLFANLKYFLERIMPVCNEYDIKMAIHPDDPAWSVFGLPRIIINKENILRMMKMVDDPHNSVTLLLRLLRNKPGERSAGYDPFLKGPHPLRSRPQSEIPQPAGFRGGRTPFL